MRLLKPILLLVTLSAYFILVQSVSAQSVTPNTARKTKTQVWCNKIVPNIQTQITNGSTTLAKRQQWVATRKQKLQDRINKLQSMGANVTQLTTDYQTFSGMMDKWIKDFQTVITDFQATQQYTCGDAQGKFVQALKTARQQMQIVKQDGQSMETFWKNTLRPDFLTAIQQVKQKRKSAHQAAK